MIWCEEAELETKKSLEVWKSFLWHVVTSALKHLVKDSDSKQNQIKGLFSHRFEFWTKEPQKHKTASLQKRKAISREIM